MLKLAAFADEISPELDVQIEHCRKNGITHVELRGVAGKNILEFDKPLRAEIKGKLADNGLGVVCIGSPIGKVKLRESFGAHFEQFKIAVDMANFFDAPFIRIFSYYDTRANDRDEVIRRLNQKLDYLRGSKLMLLHENEARIYGETGSACLELLQAANSPKLRAAFDFANFVQAREDPLRNWPLLKPFTAHFHIKDARMGSGKVVPAGEGDGHLAEVLKDAYASGFRGFLSLEPHLAAHGQFSGFSGPELFKSAVDALRKLARENGIPLAT